MTDYGHDLQFGVFLTPANQPPDAAVRLGVRAEELGFDLVTYQDHPYQAGFHDAWTLLTWLAARTKRVQVSPMVLNLPLRQPSVIARSSASLDLLSGGRVTLGLGAGAFWDGVVAMGGARLSPGQAVDALDEAIQIIRGIWNTSDRAALRIRGRYHQVDGAKRGPEPAHPIPVWVGAYGPRMLNLTGRVADGWAPSLSYLAADGLRVGNSIVDDAARAASRDPRAIRRILNLGGRFTARRGGFLEGPAEQWVDELLPFILEDGISTFVLAGDDPSLDETFMSDVAPALREQVDAERPAAGTPPGVVRPPRALHARRPGIDYDAVPASLVDHAIEPGDPGYSRVRSTYLRGGAPGLVLPVRSVREVADAVTFARTQPVPLSVRSGGHGISGRSTNDGGIVISVAALNEVSVVDVPTRRVRVGAGARWMDVAAALEPYGWALSSGDYGGVGVGGLATAGGVGWLVRQHGLTIDHIRAVELVLADGRYVRADETTEPDLFWAMRGAGANFGVATAFEFEVDEVGDVGFATLVFDASETGPFLQRWGAVVESAPRNVTSFLTIAASRRGRPNIAQVSIMVNSPDPDTVISRLQAFAPLGPMFDQQAEMTRYANVMTAVDDAPHAGRGEPNSRSSLVRTITPELAAAIDQMLRTGDVYYFQIRAMGGAVGDVPIAATAFAHREARFALAALGVSRERMDAIWDGFREYADGLYLSFSTDPRPERLHEAFPPATLERLEHVKQKYDPDNVFRDNFNITPFLATG